MESTKGNEVDHQPTNPPSPARADNPADPPVTTPPVTDTDQTPRAAKRPDGNKTPATDDPPGPVTKPTGGNGSGDTNGGDPPGDLGWNKVFTAEDVILYLLILVILLGFGYIFYDVQTRTITNVATQPSTAFWTQPDSDKTDLQFLNYHVAVADMRYRQARYITASITTRRNLAFLVGTAMAILGCMIIIRGVRGDQSEVGIELKKAYAKILSNSPGLVVVFLGTLILLSTIWKVDEVKVSDPTIQLGGQNADGSDSTGDAETGADQTPSSEETDPRRELEEFTR